MTAQLVELPIASLEQRVRDELYDNVALEEGPGAGEEQDLHDADDGLQDGDGAGEDTRNDDDRDMAGLNDDGELPVYSARNGGGEDREIPIGDTKSFIEDLEAQIGEFDVTDKQRQLIAYLIGSLDGRGFIDRPLSSISDDLLFYQNIDATPEELEQALQILQQFEPCGIGARNLQECLLLQIDQKIRTLSEQKTSNLSALHDLKTAREILADHFKLLERHDITKLAEAMGTSVEDIREAQKVIARLNPHPGRALNEAADDRVRTVVPDFIVETDHESTITFTLNYGDLPRLHVAEDYLQQLQHYQKNAQKLSRGEKDAFIYTKQKVDSAQLFINALRQRQETLTKTMRTIIALQRPFFLSQDDNQLQPLRLADVAERTGLAISTVSRVVNSKYCLLDGTNYPLKYFFLRSKQNAQGEHIIRPKVYTLLQEIIDQEDKTAPLSDDQIAKILAEKGENISRRTVAKYRNELRIPTANLRREH